MTNLPPPQPPQQPPQPAPAAPTLDVQELLDLLGPRGDRRSTPRLGGGLAALAGLLVWLGIWSIAGDALGGDGDSDPNKWLGFVMFFLLAVGGYGLVFLYRRGPIATAGVVTSALSLPAMVFFATLDVDGGDLPSLFVIWTITTVLLLAAYALGPARGHTGYLGVALFGMWAAVVGASASDTLFGSESDLLFGDSGTSLLEGGEADLATAGLLSLVIAAVYFGAGWVLDRQDKPGLATPFFGIANLAGVVAALFLFADGDDVFLPGVVMAGLGALALRVGVGSARRFTTWNGVALVVVGVSAVLGEMFEGPVAQGVVLIFGATALLVVAAWVAARVGEPDDTDPATSFEDRGLLLGLQNGSPPGPTPWWQPVDITLPVAPRPGGTAQPSWPPPSPTPAAPPPSTGPVDLPPPTGAPVRPSPPPGVPADWWLASDGNWYPPRPTA